MMPQQIPKEQKIDGEYENFAAIRLTPEEISQWHAVDWERYHEDGWGITAAAVFRLHGGGFYVLRHLYEAPIPATTIMLEETVENPAEKIEQICEEFGFTLKDIVWFSDELQFRNVDLYRQDDNGCEVCVGRFPFRPDAVAKMRDLESGGHKQFYEVRFTDRNTIPIPTDSEGFLLNN